MGFPVFAVTSGEPAGIGPDICLDLAFAGLPCRTVVLGDKELLGERARQLGKKIKLLDFDPERPSAYSAAAGELEVLHIPLRAPCEAGQLNPANAAYVLELLDTAYRGIADGIFEAMITAPLHKGVINDGLPEDGFFSGHTEYLAEKSGTEQVVMMLAGGGLRVALVTTHLPLKDVAAAVNRPLVESVVRILYADLRDKFGIAKPVILMAGLNPHAGEGGHLGHEEIDVLMPALAGLREEGIDVRGPYPADTLFQPFMLKDADAVLAMYHDQGLPVLKYASFGKGVNVTLGLPFVRTSVDHGTALDLAATGRADSGSLKVAVETALAMTANRSHTGA
ncbi:4-hydroxythreonine-4-phosphate dehydrogenase PdxA [Neisseria animalis]|uniref:4-hydroxythreonine-4-phosphate dehydrogenase n=1 Tax=Neisseria animalis TaxID=492 RepID=A0A5P3MQJ8_NEIAN|nr:4-hydroxythreonine-4-phosphate dehydrogenase PdxA [Neisseria animalis]QEY23798.1 4-hydroxythreonine-4-phosphate dehydrogenase PdxA [Neisseria animalis]ROW31436.1 4-hydroxythreonine-4-phosphate dehydrogenase PdxA [Neisseria animalis]VEE09742.1 4-hydroxythreonine-4-phosphate dehydrogenase [Neisseria animalis]